MASGVKTATQQGVAGLHHAEEGATPPNVGRLRIQSHGSRRIEPFEAGAAVLMHGRFLRTVSPAKEAAFVDRMQSVDEYESAAKRDPDRNAMIAEPLPRSRFRERRRGRLRSARAAVRSRSFSSMGNHASAEARNSHPDSILANRRHSLAVSPSGAPGPPSLPQLRERRCRGRHGRWRSRKGGSLRRRRRGAHRREGPDLSAPPHAPARHGCRLLRHVSSFPSSKRQAAADFRRTFDPNRPTS